MSKGEREDFEELERRVAELERKNKTLFDLIKGIAIGLLIGGVIFGIIQIKDLISVLK